MTIPSQMKAAVFREYGPAEVVRCAEIPTPVPKSREVLIEVHATTVSAEDPALRAFDHRPLLKPAVGLIMGYRRPRITVLGMEVAGRVAAVGARVSRFAIGDDLFGYTGIRLGAHAEYVCVRESGVLARTPAGLDAAAAASLPNAMLTALVFLRDLGRVQAGERVLVNGASGAVGTAAVQLATYLGARVTAVCSGPNGDLVRSLGAADVIDYTRERIADRGGQYDVILDAVSTTSYAEVAPLLAPGGRYLVTQAGPGHLWAMMRTRCRGRSGVRHRVRTTAANFRWRSEDLELVGQLVSAGVVVPVIDRRYPLAEVVQAHRYVEQGHKRGNVVLIV